MQQNNPKNHSVFLDHHLKSPTNSDVNLKNLNSINSTSILQSWSNLRNPSIKSQPNLINSSLQTLTSLSPLSLHLSPPQINTLLSLLSSPSLSSHSLSLISRLLYIYLRKTPNLPPQIINSFISNLDTLLSCDSSSGLLLVGALVACKSVDDGVCDGLLDRLCGMLDRAEAWDDGCVCEAVSGAGYGLVRANEAYIGRLVGILFGKVRPSLDSGVMVLKMFEWVLLECVEGKDWKRVEMLCREIERREGMGFRFGVLMAAFGVLRGFNMSGRVNFSVGLKNSMEMIVGCVASFVVSSDENGMERKLLLQCISIGLVRCGPITFIPQVCLCLCLGLLKEIFPMQSLFKMVIENADRNFVLEKVIEHSNSILFKEAGAITGVFCNQYSMADQNHKVMVENKIWDFTQSLYFDLRKTVLLLQGKNEELVKNLDKIAEATFLMVVVFASEVTKQKLNSKLLDKFEAEVAVKILVAFSCIEYLRRLRLPEYTEAVRRAVLTIQENEHACASFVESLPPYYEITNQRGTFALEGIKYIWWEDLVQTARILFCLRVVPTCISLVPTSLFQKLVAPTMFLYMWHPNDKVARASHSVFVVFTSSGNDSEQDERSALKEKLVFYYIERSLEAYPGVTPFEGLASGVAALARHLPAGSPAIFYSIHSLVEKTTQLCSKALSQDTTLWNSWEGNSEPCKKVVDLLLRLIALVDIQVLPYLLKQLAEFVVQLPKQGQNVLLDEMHTQVAESDDVTRKPVLVSWLQSLSYVCSRKKNSAKKGDNVSDRSIVSNTTVARL